MKTCGLICAHNEEATVNEIVSKTLNNVDKVIFFNDGSTDNTLENIQSKYSENKKVEIISWKENKGKITTGAKSITIEPNIHDKLVIRCRLKSKMIFSSSSWLSKRIPTGFVK